MRKNRKTRRIITAVVWMITLVLLLGYASAEIPEEAREPLDFSDPLNWVYSGTEDGETTVDVFFIAPSVFGGKEGSYLMDLSNEKGRANFTGAVNMEKGIYDQGTRFYAPFYRQVGYNVYVLPEEEAELLKQSAYDDVRDAFAFYMEHWNGGRPIILAGFSQGADMAIRLMKDCFWDDSLQNRLIACYAIGWRLTEEEADEWPQLRPAQGETDTGVIIAFSAEAEDAAESVIFPAGMKSLSINPLNWKTDGETADKAMNLGACFPNYEGEIQEEIPALTGTYLDTGRGALKVTDIDPEVYNATLPILGPGNYHLYDYQFFYRNLQQNVQDRIQSYQNGRTVQALAESPAGLFASALQAADSPEWITALPAAQEAEQLLVVAGIGMDRTTAFISMHQKDADGNWKQILSSPGFVGKNGLCPDEDHREGCAQTPAGIYHFNKAFGIAADPGCAIPYIQVDDNTYWSGDPDRQYNQMVDIRDVPDLVLDDSEHIVDYEYQYQYCLNISFNEDGTPGRGSAIFLHCFGPAKPWTGGCVAVPENIMKLIMQNVREDCVVVIDTLENMGGSL